MISSDAGEVSVVGVDGTATEAELALEYRGSRPEIVLDVEGDRLLVDIECPRLSGRRRVDVDLQIPADVAVVEIDGGAGDLELDGLAGDLELGVGAGDIAGTDLRGQSVAAATGAGRVDLELIEAFEELLIDTGTGGIELVVPAGPYALELTTGTGRVRTEGVTDDPDAAAAIRASSGTGDITVRGAEG